MDESSLPEGFPDPFTNPTPVRDLKEVLGPATLPVGTSEMEADNLDDGENDDDDEWEYEYSNTETDVGFHIPPPTTHG